MFESLTHVRDAAESPYATGVILDASSLASVGEANLRFLGLVAERAALAAGAVLGLAPVTAARIRDLSAASRLVVAQCPYTLFDLRFRDAAFWHGIAGEDGAGTLGSDANDAALARMAVFLAWHLAQSNDLAAALTLGMSEDVKRIWRGIPLSALDRAASAALPQLEARWGHNATFWPQLIDTAGPAEQHRAEAIRLLGLQLLAADGLARQPADAVTGS